MKLIFALLIITCTICREAQGQSAAREQKLLKVGDSLPDLTLPYIVNFFKTSAKLSDFNDKLLILDFWTTSCVPCIQAFPLLDSLQRIFQDKVQFMPVTWEEKDKINYFFARIKKKRNYVLPSAVDTVLYKYFVDQYKWAGQYAWVKNGQIIAITTGKEMLTEKNIKNVLSGGNLIMDSQQAGELIPEDFSSPVLFSSISGRHNKVKYHSIITGFINGLEPKPYSKFPTIENQTSGLRIINLPLVFFYVFAYQLSGAEIIYELRNREIFDPPVSRRDSSNLYCYELLIPNTDQQALLKLMREDLTRFFGFVIKKERREVHCAILKRSGKERLSASGDSAWATTNFYITMKGHPFKILSSWLRYYMISEKIPFLIDETGINEGKIVDISLDCDLSDPAATAVELRKYGLNLSIEKRYKEMWVIKDPGK